MQCVSPVIRSEMVAEHAPFFLLTEINVQPNPHPHYYKHCDETKSETGSDLIEAHGKQFLYFTCVVGTRDRGACIDVRPQPCSLFEHFLVLLILRMQRESTLSSVNDMKKKK